MSSSTPVRSARARSRLVKLVGTVAAAVVAARVPLGVVSVALGVASVALGVASVAVAEGVRDLALHWIEGDFRAPLTCIVDGVPRQALRRIRIHPGPPETARPTARVAFFDLEAPAGTRCTSFSGEAEPNVLGTIDLVYDGRSRPDTGEVDFRNALRREGGFTFKIETGHLRIADAGADARSGRQVDFGGGTARVETAAPGSDAARRLTGFDAKRQLVLQITAPGEAPLSFDLVELPSH